MVRWFGRTAIIMNEKDGRDLRSTKNRSSKRARGGCCCYGTCVASAAYSIARLAGVCQSFCISMTALSLSLFVEQWTLHGLQAALVFI